MRSPGRAAAVTGTITAAELEQRFIFHEKNTYARYGAGANNNPAHERKHGNVPAFFSEKFYGDITHEA